MGNQESTQSLSEHEIARLSAETNFTPAEVAQWYKGFKRDCPSGKFTMARFQAIAEGFFPAGDAENFTKFIFNGMDLEEDASLNFESFIKVTSLLARGTKEEKLKWAFHVRDIDHTGFITKEKMQLVEDSVFSMIANHVPLPDDENTAEKRTEKLYNLIEKDQDGKVTVDQFKVGLNQDRDIVNALSLHDTVQ
uniref:Neuronal calcium sensor 1-like n=1 Tax=Ciona intestinalis TaxID=7719 RepID=F7ASM9_CIOIN|nr:neuronal calcium sensor 1-like [Ciona intestinalis]|eukprot:XP_002126335.1 neuronal calcium sensor 1-like [Ciona intestinalis]